MAVALQSIGDSRSGDADDRSLTSKPLVQDSILISRCRMLVWPRLNMAVSLSLNDCLAVDLPYRPKIKCISRKWLLKNLSYAHKLTGTKTPLSRENLSCSSSPKKTKHKSSTQHKNLLLRPNKPLKLTPKKNPSYTIKTKKEPHNHPKTHTYPINNLLTLNNKKITKTLLAPPKISKTLSKNCHCHPKKTFTNTKNNLTNTKILFFVPKKIIYPKLSKSTFSNLNSLTHLQKSSTKKNSHTHKLSTSPPPKKPLLISHSPIKLLLII